MAKVQKETTFLVSSAGTGFFYTSRRNKKKLRGGAENKLKLNKYDPVAKEHVLFEEKKLSALKKKYNPAKAVESDTAAE
jgi:large subunit ribosomal protein L33